MTKRGSMNELDLACFNLKQALYNPYAITRREARKKDVAEAWRLMSLQSAQKKTRASNKTLALNF